MTAPGYPLADKISRAECAALGIPEDTAARMSPRTDDGVIVRAVRALGRPRPPRAGEWYISGAIPHAYRAPNDLKWPYVIAELRLFRRVESWERVR